MPDLKKYWQEVRVLEKGLDDFVWLVSESNAAKGLTGGVIAEVARESAARLLHARSHRLAKPEEIEAHQSKEDEQRRQAFHQRLQRMGVAVVPLASPRQSPAKSENHQ